MERSEIIKTNKERDLFLNSIKLSDVKTVEDMLPYVSEVLFGDKLGLIDRVKKDKLRSMKNICLSYNTLYFMAALDGGADPLISHYMAEKYAIIIESIDKKQEIKELHNSMALDYADPKYKQKNMDNLKLYQKINKYIDNNFMNDISIDDIANEFSLSSAHMMRIYKADTDNTINTYLNDRRIEESKHLLKYSNLSITDIALSVGFNSSQYFSTIFYQKVGVSPSEYRKKYW